MLQTEDPAVQWQLNLYKDVEVKSEEPLNTDHIIEKIQGISAAVFHLEQVRSTLTYYSKHYHFAEYSKPQMRILIPNLKFQTLSFSPHTGFIYPLRWSSLSGVKNWYGRSSCPNSASVQWLPVSAWHLCTISLGECWRNFMNCLSSTEMWVLSCYSHIEVDYML